MSIKLPDGRMLPLAYIDHVEGPIICLKTTKRNGVAIFVGEQFAAQVQQAIVTEGSFRGVIPDIEKRLDEAGFNPENRPTARKSNVRVEIADE